MLNVLDTGFFFFFYVYQTYPILFIFYSMYFVTKCLSYIKALFNCTHFQYVYTQQEHVGFVLRMFQLIDKGKVD